MAKKQKTDRKKNKPNNKQADKGSDKSQQIKKPEYHQVKVECDCGNTFEIGSTRKRDISVEICSACHPLYTGKKKLIDTTGRVKRFKEMMKKSEEIKKDKENSKDEKSNKKAKKDKNKKKNKDKKKKNKTKKNKSK